VVGDMSQCGHAVQPTRNKGYTRVLGRPRRQTKANKAAIRYCIEVDSDDTNIEVVVQLQIAREVDIR
jgi:hypothetical protein